MVKTCLLMVHLSLTVLDSACTEIWEQAIISPVPFKEASIRPPKWRKLQENIV